MYLSITTTTKNILLASVDEFAKADISYMPSKLQTSITESLDKARATFDRVADIRTASASLDDYVVEYRPLHQNVRAVRRVILGYEREIEELSEKRDRLEENNVEDRADFDEDIAELEAKKRAANAKIPEDWTEKNKAYAEQYKTQRKAKRAYRRHVDESYEVVVELREVLAATDALVSFEPRFAAVESAIKNPDNEAAMDEIKVIESELSNIKGASKIKSKISKARRALKGDSPKRDKAMNLLSEAQELYAEDIIWRKRAQREYAPSLEQYNEAVKSSIGLRLQERFTTDQAHSIASCQSVHRDISLNF